MKLFKSRIFIICLIAAILLTLVPTVIAAFGGTDLLRAAFGTVSKPFVMCASGIANAFNGFVNVFTQYDKLKAENEELRELLAEYESKEYNEQLLLEQNSWLRDYLNIHSKETKFTLSDARVIAREASNYSTVLTLNRGSIHGIKKDLPVVTSAGLLGYVSELGLDWCRVITITEATSSVGVYTERGGVLGVVEGDPELRHEGLCKMSYIEGESNIQIGDRVFTSGGKSSFYPSGILIGSISSIDIDEVTGDMVATVTPAVNFNSLGAISEVMIITGLSSAGGN